MRAQPARGYRERFAGYAVDDVILTLRSTLSTKSDALLGLRSFCDMTQIKPLTSSAPRHAKWQHQLHRQGHQTRHMQRFVHRDDGLAEQRAGEH